MKGFVPMAPLALTRRFPAQVNGAKTGTDKAWQRPPRHELYVPISEENGGEGGIRTHGQLAPTTVFETVPIDHSGTSPHVGQAGRLNGGL